MKKLTITLIALVAMLATMAQTPNGFNYQTALRDAEGNMMTDQTVAFQISILQGTADGTAVYVETHTSTTDAHGLANFHIGEGTTTDDFTIIDWANGPYFIKVELDVAGGTNYVEMGTQQLLSVPYAKYAESSADVAALLDRLTVLEEMNGIGTMTDIDGNEYEMTKIGNQIWMAENLRVTKYADGTPLEYVADSATWNDNVTNTSKSYAYYDYDSATYAAQYGALYTWYAATNGVNIDEQPTGVQGICPDGWHMPSNEEWQELVTYLTNHGFNGTEAIALKSTTGWDENGNGTDDFGFNWLPAGFITNNHGGSIQFGRYSWFWSSSENSFDNYRAVWAGYSETIVTFSTNENRFGTTVRCIKD